MKGVDDILRSRRSVRRFTEAPVPDELLRELMDLAFCAPTPMNRQDGHGVIVTAPDVRRAVADAVEAGWRELLDREGGVYDALRSYTAHFSAFRQAPVLVAFYARKPSAFLCDLVPDEAERLAGDVTSGAMEAYGFMLAAQARGLGTCFFSGPVAVQADLKDILQPPKGRMLIGIVALGWPAEAPAPPARKPVDTRLSWIHQTRD